MNKAAEFLNACKIFYIATVEEDQPRVRPFGAVCEFKGKTYICTNNTKNVFKQIKANPKVEISGTTPDGKWIRITANAVADPSREAKAEMLNANPSLNNLYKLDDGIFEVLYLEDATASIYSFGGAPETFTF